MGILAGYSDAKDGGSRRTDGDAGTSEDLKIIGPEARRQVTQPWSKRSTRQDKAGDDGQSKGKTRMQETHLQVRTERWNRRADDGLRPRINRSWGGARARRADHCGERKSFAGGCQRRCFGFEVANLETK